jgi:hypothetical protein
VPCDIVIGRNFGKDVLASVTGSTTLELDTSTISELTMMNLTVIATNADGDYSVQGIQLIYDDAAPLLVVDYPEGGFYPASSAGNFTVSGFTDPFQTVVLTGGIIADADEDGRFHISGKIAGDSDEVVVSATDTSGNSTSMVVPVAVRAGSGSNSGGGRTYNPAHASPTAATIAIHGIDIPYTIDADGIVTLKLTEEQVKAIIDAAKDGKVIIDVSGIPGAKGIILEANHAWWGIEKFVSLTFVVDGTGSVLVKEEILQNLAKSHTNLQFILKKGSLVFDIAEGGRSINYNDPANPLFISIPLPLAAATNTYGYTGVKKDAAGDKIMPYSSYKDGAVTFKTAATGTYGTVYNAKAFTDTSGHWASGNITFVSARGLFGGIGNGLFDPNSTMTRAMFAQVLANIEGVDLSVYTASSFADAAAGAWYAPAVEWAAGAGIVSGYGNGLFGPEDDISREQMAQMLINYVKYKGYALPARQTATFNDEASIASWAYEAVKQIQAAGVVSGKPGNIYDPKGNATRAEVATIFARFIEVYLNYAMDIESTAIPAAAASSNAARFNTQFGILPGKRKELVTAVDEAESEV